jgi:protocatechuate 3,4-dioxygenase beta subunit
MRVAGLLIAAAICCDAQTFRVAGTVLDSETATPVRKARMSLSAAGRTKTFVTGTDGRFEFDVADGKYSLSADVHEIRQNYGRRTPDSGFGIAVVVGPGQNTSDLVFRWFPPATVSGRVIDQFGEPVETAKVSLIRIVVLNGHKRVYFYGAKYSDDRGEYRFGSLLPGSYYITVSGTPWYASRALTVPMRLSPSAPLTSAAFAAMYYPATHDPRAAAPIVIKPGQEGRADFTLDETPGVTINVHCEGGPRAKSLALIGEGVNGFQDAARQLSMNAGDAAITGVPPGRYAVRITATENGRNLAAWQSVEVGSSDVAVQLALKPAPSIVGTVEFKDPSTRPRGTVAIRVTYDVTGFTVSRTVAADGSFEFANFPVGRYQVLGISGSFASDIFTEDGALQDGYFDLIPGPPMRVRVVASDATSSIKGFVKVDDRTMEGVMVVLAMQKDSENVVNYRAFQTDSDGSFDIQSVRPGEYYLFAVDSPDLEWTNPAAIRPYFAGARSIRIEPHKSYDEILSLSVVARQAIQ